ncbi:uncharacterized protein CDAR_283341 [Caerostris darwini]|uniref:Uncharacterized protein n=1 Tax=Caerostris darwini TaxID=1538125 RepID=A0AAV4UEB7_9ARAC|nr:uncharacterized protein CDAR_283341 [Caerostris darwini]
MSFYLTLPSNSSLHNFPNKKSSSFVTQLPSSITLDGQWEVGLAEIIYYHTWYNVNDMNNMFGFDMGDGKLNTRKLSPGSYETIPDILKVIALTSHEGKINFKFNHHTKRVKIETTDGDIGLCSMLGFQPQVIENIKGSSFMADHHTEFPIFYVYSDIIQPVTVGHVEAPLLRVVRISGKDGDVFNVLFHRPHYVPVILCCSKKFEELYTNQSGSGIPHYEGISFQRGYGLGGVFRRLFRAALPFLVRGGKVVGKEAPVTGTKVINGVLSGKDLETAAKSRSKEAGKSLVHKAINRVQSMIGQGVYKRKRKNRKRVISSKTRKVSELDILISKNYGIYFMAFTPECVKSELELFPLPTTQKAIEGGHWVEFHPLSKVFDGGPVEFHISGSGEEYVDLSQTQLFVKAKK